MRVEGPGLPDFDPNKNPAVFDTLTWDDRSLASSVLSPPPEFWERVHTAVRKGEKPPKIPGLKLYEHSAGNLGNTSFILLENDDGQHALAEFATRGEYVLIDEPLLCRELKNSAKAYFHEVNAWNLQRVYRKVAPVKLPQALPSTPRLGIGTRMSRTVWPGIWRALAECPFTANAIQNSMRELNLLEKIRSGEVGQQLYEPGIGFVPEGHTGSTFEGLWLCGVTEGLKSGIARPYGADADHIMVKRDVEGLEKTRRVLVAARYYSFFTIDVSDILDYSAFSAGGLPKVEPNLLDRCITDKKTRKEICAYYKKPLKMKGRSSGLSESELAALVVKYWRAIDSLDVLIPFIKGLRVDGEPFDLELSMDEHPPEIHPFDCLTSEIELAFVLEEMKRRGRSISHVAPNLGIEKHFDYRYPDGPEGLEARTRALHEIAGGYGTVIDCHSGDDLSRSTRQALKKATGGMIHFKISPYLQTLFADVLYDFDRRLFHTWWEDTCEFVRLNARQGSALAISCLREYESDPGTGPHPKFALFRLFCYATVGKRDPKGNFLFRDR